MKLSNHIIKGASNGSEQSYFEGSTYFDYIIQEGILIAIITMKVTEIFCGSRETRSATKEKPLILGPTKLTSIPDNVANMIPVKRTFGWEFIDCVVTTNEANIAVTINVKDGRGTTYFIACEGISDVTGRRTMFKGTGAKVMFVYLDDSNTETPQ